MGPRNLRCHKYPQWILSHKSLRTTNLKSEFVYDLNLIAVCPGPNRILDLCTKEMFLFKYIPFLGLSCLPSPSQHSSLLWIIPALLPPISQHLQLPILKQLSYCHFNYFITFLSNLYKRLISQECDPCGEEPRPLLLLPTQLQSPATHCHLTPNNTKINYLFCSKFCLIELETYVFIHL